MREFLKDLGWNRFLSLVVAAIYVVLCVVGVIAGEPASVLLMAVSFLLMPLGCIWLPRYMGGYTGRASNMSHIARPSPAFLVVIVGWILLLAPLMFAIASMVALYRNDN